MSIALVATLMAWSAALPAIAGALPEDDCDRPPQLVAELDPLDPESTRGPVFVNGYVWNAGAIYRPDGTFVRAAPTTGSLRGELREFNAEIVDPSGATWGVVGTDDGDSAAVYSPNGTTIVELPSGRFVEAVYDDDLVLATESIQLGSTPLTAVLVDETGAVVTLPAAPMAENMRFGAVVDGIVFLILPDGSLARFDSTGSRLGTVPSPGGIGFREVFAEHGFVYATSAFDANRSTTVLVLDADGGEVNRLDHPPGHLELHATERGLAVQFVRAVDEGDGQQAGSQVEISLLTPTGHLLGSYESTFGDTEEDRVFKSHGRYLLVADRVSYGPGAEEPFEPATVTSRIVTLLADGSDMGRTQDITHSEYGIGRPAGKLIAYRAVNGRSIEFRDLSGRLLGEESLGLGPYASIELMMTDHRYLWVRTSEVDAIPPTVQTERTFVLDLGECAGLPASGTFVDDDASVFEADAEWLSHEGNTRGCDPELGGTRYCPDEAITRGQMAAFFRRALGASLAVGDPLPFDDVSDSVFAEDIGWLSAAGITAGCTGTSFCPDDPVTRGQMAAFMTRALDLGPAPSAAFDDLAGGVFSDDIARLAASGITRGCTTTSFCPDELVTRGQMAAFFRRAIG